MMMKFLILLPLPTKIAVNVRFIEYMPFKDNQWTNEKVVTYKGHAGPDWRTLSIDQNGQRAFRRRQGLSNRRRSGQCQLYFVDVG